MTKEQNLNIHENFSLAQARRDINVLQAVIGEYEEKEHTLVSQSQLTSRFIDYSRQLYGLMPEELKDAPVNILNPLPPRKESSLWKRLKGRTQDPVGLMPHIEIYFPSHNHFMAVSSTKTDNAAYQSIGERIRQSSFGEFRQAFMDGMYEQIISGHLQLSNPLDFTWQNEDTQVRSLFVSPNGPSLPVGKMDWVISVLESATESTRTSTPESIDWGLEREYIEEKLETVKKTQGYNSLLKNKLKNAAISIWQLHQNSADEYVPSTLKIYELPLGETTLDLKSGEVTSSLKGREELDYSGTAPRFFYNLQSLTPPASYTF